MKIFAQRQRRNAIRMAGLYLVAAWLLTQVAGTILPTQTLQRVVHGADNQSGNRFARYHRKLDHQRPRGQFADRAAGV